MSGDGQRVRAGTPTARDVEKAMALVRDIDEAVIGRCRSCGRDLIDWRKAQEGDPRADCGGDCAACQREFERGLCDEHWVSYDALTDRFPADLGMPS